MTGYQNLHTHTTYCDGSLPPEDMIKAAIEKGNGSIGFSEHSHVYFDMYYSMDRHATGKYVDEIRFLKEKYADIIEVFLGLEQDFHTESIPEGLDYTIGTLHYLKIKDQVVTVDSGAKSQKYMVRDFFGGDYYAMTEEYFSVFSKIIEKTNADIVGHFDLITKYNFDGSLFDENHPRYVGAALGAMEEILKKNNLFEVNTGAMYRLGKPEPYPSVFLLRELQRRGGQVILTSDSHDAGSLCYMFDEMTELLKSCGYKYRKHLTKDGFIDIKL